MENHNELYQMWKIPFKLLLENNFSVSISKDAGDEQIVSQAPSPLLDQIERIRGQKTDFIDEFIIVDAKKNPKKDEEMRKLFREGFQFNDVHYVRFGKSAAQGKNGITCFVDEKIYEELYDISQLGLKIDECVISQYEAYRCLIFSSCTLVEDYMPQIVIIDEYTKILPDQYIRYVVNRKKEVIDKETGEKKTWNAREVEEGNHDIKLSPFDGFGCHEAVFSHKISDAIGLDYTAIGAQVRLPFMKGYSVYVPFRDILHSWGVDTITDVYGHVHNVDDIDCIWNTSMFKGNKYFKKAFGNDAWNEYLKAIKKYKFKLGISKYSHHTKDLNLQSRMNYQYLQCLDLQNEKYAEAFDNKFKDFDILDENCQGDIVKLAKYTTNLFQRVILGDKFYTLKFMGIMDTEGYNPVGKYIEACMINDTMFQDPAIKRQIQRKLKKNINQAKLGKIYASGFQHTVVGDIIGYLEQACGKEVVGCLSAGEFYCKTLPHGDALSMRSPLVCPSEVNKIRIVSNKICDKQFGYFANQDVVMLNMYDLSAPQQGGMDYDGDAVFLCNDKKIIDKKINKPIIIDIEDKATAQQKQQSQENLIDYEMKSRDSFIGIITNHASSIINKRPNNDEVKKLFDDYVSLLRVQQGKEIDYIKTGVRWQLTSGIRKYGSPLPYFMLYNYPQKLEKYKKISALNKEVPDYFKAKLNAQRSPSPMNELCEYINEWEKRKILWDNSCVNTTALIINPEQNVNDRILRRFVKHEINEFAVELKEYAKREDSIEGYVDNLVKKHKKNLNNLFYERSISYAFTYDKDIIANFVISVSYSNSAVNKTFAWMGYGDTILKNLRANSPDRKSTKIIESKDGTYEWLGKKQLMQEGGQDDIPVGAD